MFGFFKKEKAKGIVIHAFSNGEYVSLEKVSDPVFAQKLLGDGFGIEPSDGKIKAPVSGKISTVFPTKHAIGITTDEGLEVLLHLGFNTVELNGEPFTSFVKEGDQVETGDLLTEMDIESIQSVEAVETTCVLVFTNGNDKIQSISFENLREVHVGENICTVTLK
ncbi:PTS glucose transporter subunit IIA [Aerococcus tenax]|uniref:PTS sugar transporter subunit IIA n=1 Tax=Aerococcus tenax TaxID=3078812 RepID=UPI0018A77E79|nr:PTS glucose transporter subunit IIA [Aerococcus tenax]